MTISCLKKANRLLGERAIICKSKSNGRLWLSLEFDLDIPVTSFSLLDDDVIPIPGDEVTVLYNVQQCLCKELKEWFIKF